MDEFLAGVAVAFGWVGHACIWTALLSHLYGRPLPKRFLKPWRYITGLIILAFPMLLLVPESVRQFYVWPCCFFGAVVLPAITVPRLLRKRPACVVSEVTRTRDLWPELGAKLIGDGHLAALARLPGNGLFRVDFTDLTLALPDLPPEWDGLTILSLSDLHFHGTPARPFFDRIIDELTAGPAPDLVCLIGDYVDTKTHHEWIAPVLGRLSATAGKFAILGNHDLHRSPDRVRTELAAAGYTVLGNGWREVTIRGVRCVVVGHEGPWFAPAPDLTAAPPEPFRLCLSHTPDNFYWGIANRISLMLCGHVHGGAIRIPVVGSIFVPSVYGRRFDHGVFAKSGTVMAVNRGLSGKEPLRIRCNPQVMRVKLVRRVSVSPRPPGSVFEGVHMPRLLAVLFLAVASGWLAAEPPKEPSHEGRTLSEWVKQLDTDDPDIRKKAYEAMRAFAGRPDDLAEAVLTAAADPKSGAPIHAGVLVAMGSRSVPVLTAALWSPDERTRRVAALMLINIGEDARPATSALLRVLNEKSAEERNAAAQALGSIGAESAIPALTKLLTDRDPGVAMAAANSLGLLGAETTDIIPALTELFDSKVPRIPESAARTIGAFGPEAAAAVPAILPRFTVEGLKKSPELILSLIEATGKIGPGAKDAGPVLKALVRDLGKDAGPLIYPVAVTLWRIARDPEAVKMLQATLGDWNAESQRNAEVLWRIDSGPETVAVFENLLKSEKPEAVIAAAGLLGAKSKTAVAQLGKLAAHKDAKVRARAVVALVMLGPDAKPAAEALAAVTKDDDPLIAFWATVGVCRLDPKPDNVTALVGYLSDRNAEQRLAAIENLTRLGAAAKPAVARLTAALTDPEEQVRLMAAVALWKIEKNPSALPAAVELLRSSDSLSRSLVAVDLSAEFGADAKTAVPELIKRLYDPFSKVRSSAAESFGRIGPAASAAVRPLIALLDGDEPGYVQSAACESLGLIGLTDPADAEAGAALLKKKLNHADPLTRTHAALALARLSGDKSGEKIAERGLTQRTHGVRITAAETLWLLKKDERVVPLLIRTLEESNLEGTGGNNERYMAARALGRVGPPAKAALPELRKLLNHPDWMLAATAATAIKAIEAK